MNNANLKPFQKGVSGNPSGRPKVPALDVLLSETCSHEEMKNVINALLKSAKKGNVRAIEVLMDRIYGKAKSEIHFTDQTPRAIIDYSKLSQSTLDEILLNTYLPNEDGNKTEAL